MQLDVDGVAVPIHMTTLAVSGRPVVLVLHDRWGFDHHVRGVVDRIGKAGFVAAAVGLFDPPGLGLEAQADKLVDGLEVEQVRRTLGGALDLLKSLPDTSGRLGVLGYGMGGGIAMWLAAEHSSIRACVAYTPTTPWAGMQPDFDSRHTRFLGHYGAFDGRASPHTAYQLEMQLRERGIDATFETYKRAGQEFYRPDQPRQYDPEATELAWSRTVAFLGRAL